MVANASIGRISPISPSGHDGFGIRTTLALPSSRSSTCSAVGAPFDKRHILAERSRLGRLQTGFGEDFFGRVVVPAPGEDRHTAPQTHPVSAAEVETVITDFQKVAVDFRAAENCDSPRDAADRRARLLE